MIYIITLIFSVLGSITAVHAQSSLLDSVKRNPSEARELCSQFKSLNSKGISASSNQSINAISKQRGLNPKDAEILSMYVRGLHCSDVF